jgi:hypothetical protein
MPKAWNKNRLFILSISLFFLGTLIKLVLSFKSELGLTIAEAEAAYLAKSIPYALTSEGKPILDFARQHGYFLFPGQLVFLLLFVHSSPLSVVLLRIPQLVVSFASMTVLFLLVFKGHKNTPNRNTLFLLSAFIILFSPWHQSLAFFYLPESLSLLFFSVVILLLTRITRKKILSPKQALFLSLSLLFSALSSWAGLFSTLVLSPLIPIFLKKFVDQQQVRQLVIASILVVYLPLGSIILANRQYIKTSLSHETFLSKLKPSSLAEEINERQKIDFLAVNKKFVLPQTLRKFIYNKPLLATQKTEKQIVSLFDFEQFAFPLISYDITHLSGLLPKGNLPLGYFWDIPLLLTGLFILLKRLPKKNSWLPYLLLPAITPAIIFEKKNFITSGSLLLPIFLVIEIEGLKLSIRTLSKLSALSKRVIIIILIIIIPMGVFSFYNLFFFNEFAYRTSHTYLFKQISSLLEKNRNYYQRIIVTTRFGPTHLMSAFYLDIAPQKFWLNFLYPEKIGQEEVVKIENLEFRPINFPDEKKSSGIAYIGLPGEFVEPGKNLELRELPTRAAILAKVVAPDELVFNFGENLWLITFP